MEIDIEGNTLPSYFDSRFGLVAIKVGPGQGMVVKDGTMLVSIVASCMLVCVNDKETGIGGMAQFAVPGDRIQLDNGPGFDVDSGRRCLDTLFSEIMRAGARGMGLQARIYGAGKLVNGFVDGMSPDVNLAFALRFLKSNYIPVVAHDVSGNVARKVYFTPKDDSIVIKTVRKLANYTLIERERKYIEELRQRKGVAA